MGLSTMPSGVSVISRSLPSCRPSRSRSGFGKMTRPALSILSLMQFNMAYGIGMAAADLAGSSSTVLVADAAYSQAMIFLVIPL